MASRVRDMRGKAADPLERVECDGDCASPWIGRRIHNQVAVIEFDVSRLKASQYCYLGID